LSPVLIDSASNKREKRIKQKKTKPSILILVERNANTSSRLTNRKSKFVYEMSDSIKTRDELIEDLENRLNKLKSTVCIKNLEENFVIDEESFLYSEEYEFVIYVFLAQVFVHNPARFSKDGLIKEYRLDSYFGITRAMSYLAIVHAECDKCKSKSI
jgi:hypothetical protein